MHILKPRVQDRTHIANDFYLIAKLNQLFATCLCVFSSKAV